MTTMLQNVVELTRLRDWTETADRQPRDLEQTKYDSEAEDVANWRCVRRRHCWRAEEYW